MDADSDQDAIHRRRGGWARWTPGRAVLGNGMPRPKPPFTPRQWICELQRQINCGLVASEMIANWYRRWIAACEWELEMERRLKHREEREVR